MGTHWILACVGLAGCGAVSPLPQDDVEAAPDAASATARCRVNQPFAPPTLVGELSSSVRETNVRLSRDELTAYISRGDPASGAIPSTAEILVASRTRRDEPFGSPGILALDTPDAPTDAMPSPDGLSLYVTLRSLPLPDNAIAKLAVARRNAPTAPFDAPRELETLNQEPNVSDPNEADQQLYVTPSGSVYFASNRNDSLLLGNLWHADVSGAGFTPPSPLAELSEVVNESFPVVSDDGLVIYFAREISGQLDILMASRATTTEPFSAPQPVKELNSTVGDRPSWLSADGCRLYLTSARPGGVGLFDVWLAEKTPEVE